MKPNSTCKQTICCHPMQATSIGPVLDMARCTGSPPLRSRSKVETLDSDFLPEPIQRMENAPHSGKSPVCLQSLALMVSDAPTEVSGSQATTFEGACLRTSLQWKRPTLGIFGPGIPPKFALQNFGTTDFDRGELVDGVTLSYVVEWNFGMQGDISKPTVSYPDDFRNSLKTSFRALVKWLESCTLSTDDEIASATENRRQFGMVEESAEESTSTTDDVAGYVLQSLKQSGWTGNSRRSGVVMRHSVTSASGSRSVYLTLNRHGAKSVLCVPYMYSEVLQYVMKEGEAAANRLIPHEVEEGSQTMRQSLHAANLLIELCYMMYSVLKSAGYEEEDLRTLKSISSRSKIPSIAMPGGLFLSKLSEENATSLSVLDFPGLSSFSDQILYKDHEVLRRTCLPLCDSIILGVSASNINLPSTDGHFFRCVSESTLPSLYDPYTTAATDLCEFGERLVCCIYASEPISKAARGAAKQTLQKCFPFVKEENTFVVDSVACLKSALTVSLVQRCNRLPRDDGQHASIEAPLCEYVSKHIRGHEIHALADYGEEHQSEICKILEDSIQGDHAKDVFAAAVQICKQRHDNVIRSYRGQLNVLDQIVEVSAEPSIPLELPLKPTPESERLEVTTRLESLMRQCVECAPDFMQRLMFPRFGTDYHVERHEGEKLFVELEPFRTCANDLFQNRLPQDRAIGCFADNFRNINALHSLWKLQDYIGGILMYHSVRASMPVSKISDIPDGLSCPHVSSTENGFVVFEFGSEEQQEQWLNHVVMNVVCEEFAKYMAIEVMHFLQHNFRPMLLLSAKTVFTQLSLTDRRILISIIEGAIDRYVDSEFVRITPISLLLARKHCLRMSKNMLTSSQLPSMYSTSLDLNTHLVFPIIDALRAAWHEMCQIFFSPSADVVSLPCIVDSIATEWKTYFDSPLYEDILAARVSDIRCCRFERDDSPHSDSPSVLE